MSVVSNGDYPMTKTLKGCNCCNSAKRSVRLMGPNARVAYCRSCKSKTVWDALSADEIAAREAHRASIQATIDELAALFGD
jgi:hypothetical protein